MKSYGQERQTFPCWKVQTYDRMAWKDTQQQHTDQHAADQAAEAQRNAGKRARLMQIERKGRFPLPEPEPAIRL